MSNAERRALRAGDDAAVPRVMDVYAALPSITGKLELEYEGELKGGEAIARELIRLAVGRVYTRYFETANMSRVVQWFDLGGALKLDETAPAHDVVAGLSQIQGLMEKTGVLGLGVSEPDALRVSAAEFVLEGLHAHRKISRNEERGFTADDRKRETVQPEEPGRKTKRQFN